MQLFKKIVILNTKILSLLDQTWLNVYRVNVLSHQNEIRKLEEFKHPKMHGFSRIFR